MEPDNKTESCVPAWAGEILVCPRCGTGLAISERQISCGRCGRIGTVDNGILCFMLPEDDPAINWYTAVGGATFEERIKIPYTMSALDTPIYKKYIESWMPADMDALVADIGAGDGRNTGVLLDGGFKRIIVTDAVQSSLLRFRRRLSDSAPEHLERMVMIQADARTLPLPPGCLDFIITTEVLCYLNEDYAAGIQECCRLLRDRGRLLLSDRAWEGALITSMLYTDTGVRLLLDTGKSPHYMYDGPHDNMVRSRCFTEQELLDIVRAHNLRPLICEGTPIISLIFGYLRNEGKISAADNSCFAEVAGFLNRSSSLLTYRRTHLVVAEK